MRVALPSVLFVVVASTVWLPSRVALADAVPPAPDDCPRGQVGVTSHGGPQCVPDAPKDCAPGYRGEVGGGCVLAACSTDQECATGSRCLQVDTCQELRELQWTGWGWSAQRAFARDNFLGGPPAPRPEGDAPKAWVKLRICGPDGPCDAPAECRPMGLCYLTNSVGRTKAKVVAAAAVPEQLPDGVSAYSLIAPDPGRDPNLNSGSGGCRKGCSVSSTSAVVGWLALPLLAGAALWRRRRPR